MGLESATYLDDLVTTNPVSSDTVAQGDDHLRLLKAVLKASFPNTDAPRYIDQPRADLASASSPDLWAATTNYVNITGTTTITDFVDAPASGLMKIVRFDNALTLTHGASTIDLPGSANITTVAGDHAIFVAQGTTLHRCIAYFRKSGKALIVDDQLPSQSGNSGKFLTTNGSAASWDDVPTVSSASDTVAGKIEIAVQSEMEARTDTSRAVVPGRQHFHPGHPKAGGVFDGTGTPAFASGDVGVGAITDNGAGKYGLNFDTAFSNTNYWVTGNCRDSVNLAPQAFTYINSGAKTTSLIEIASTQIGSGRTYADSSEVGVAAWGDYA